MRIAVILVALACALPGHAQPLTLDQVMADPDWIGNPVEAAWWQLDGRSEEHTSELQSLMRISYAVFCLKKKNHIRPNYTTNNTYVQDPIYQKTKNTQDKTYPNSNTA